jgi:transcriptional regulator with XRE-family HTH domain
MDYGKALRLSRALTGLQQQELAELTGIDASYISLIEQGKRTPSLKLIHKLSRTLGIPVHLFTFLAMTPEDSELLDSNELASIGESLTKLILKYGADRPDRRKTSKRRKRAPAT